MKKLFLLTMLVIALASLTAIPATPNPISYRQPDGSTLEMNLRGDEFVNWGETLDGYTILSNQDGYKVYAELDENGNIYPGNVRANNIADRTPEELDFLAQQETYLSYSNSQIERLIGRFQDNNPSRMGGFPTTGTNNMLVILANFPDTSPTYTVNNFDNLMNQANYSGSGSFKDFYYENSYGQLTINSTVVGWVTLPHNKSYYGPQERWGEFARDAVVAANDAGIDFSIFDNDGDGTVDGVALVHQGLGQEISGNTNDIWSHNSSMYSYNVQFDGVDFGPYTAQPEKNNWTSMTTMGVFAHEVGHNLGTPDFYDTDYQAGGSYTGTGDWDIMAGGSYNGYPSGSEPPHHNPWTKIFYGWTDATLIDDEGDYTLPNGTYDPTIYRINTRTENEYFLLENRQQTGFNGSVPYHGMLIFHADGNHIDAHHNSNDINVDSHQGFRIRPAWGGVNGSGAPFPGSHNETEFDDTTNPNALSWAGEETNRPISQISESGGIINFHMGFEFPSETPQWLEANVNGSDVSLSWIHPQVVSNVLGYSVYRDGQFLNIIADIAQITYVDANVPDGTYEYYVTSLTNTGESDPSNTVTVQVGANPNSDNVQLAQTALLGNYPNPFNPTTTISYFIDKSSDVELAVYNVKGEKIRTLVADDVQTGQHSIVWNGMSDSGKVQPSGIYFYKLKAGTYTKSKKMILIK